MLNKRVIQAYILEYQTYDEEDLKVGQMNIQVKPAWKWALEHTL